MLPEEGYEYLCVNYQTLQVIRGSLEGIITSGAWQWICEARQHSLVTDIVDLS